MTSDDDAPVRVRSTRVCVAGDLVPATVEIDPAGYVLAIEPGPADQLTRILDVGDAIVAPAPLDLHIHGAGGHGVPPEHGPDGVDTALAAAMRHVTHDAMATAAACQWLATLPLPTRAAEPPDEHVAAAAALVAAAPSTGCIGLRVEGVFLNPRRAGVWPAGTFRAPDTGLLEAMHDAARAAGAPLRIVDVAPELPGATALIERARELGIVTSIAHTDATWEAARRAIDAGATLATHTWNAMRPLLHRDPGVVAAVLTDPRVTCELICDGVHLHPGTIALSIAAAGRGGWCAVSDASPIAGLAPGTYAWADLEVTHDGTCLRDAAGNLAGSAALLDRALQVLDGIELDEHDAALALGAVPRRVLEPTRTIGLHVGDPAWVLRSV